MKSLLYNLRKFWHMINGSRRWRYQTSFDGRWSAWHDFRYARIGLENRELYTGRMQYYDGPMPSPNTNKVVVETVHEFSNRT